MSISKIYHEILDHPTAIATEDCYEFLKQLIAVGFEDFTENLDCFFDIIDRIEYSLQESYDWVKPENEPTYFVDYLKDLRKHSNNAGILKRIQSSIEFFEWSDWPHVNVTDS